MNSQTRGLLSRPPEPGHPAAARLFRIVPCPLICSGLSHAPSSVQDCPMPPSSPQYTPRHRLAIATLRLGWGLPLNEMVNKLTPVKGPPLCNLKCNLKC